MAKHTNTGARRSSRLDSKKWQNGGNQPENMNDDAVGSREKRGSVRDKHPTTTSDAIFDSLTMFFYERLCLVFYLDSAKLKKALLDTCLDMYTR